jgi:hypothetical protein
VVAIRITIMDDVMLLAAMRRAVLLHVARRGVAGVMHRLAVVDAAVVMPAIVVAAIMMARRGFGYRGRERGHAEQGSEGRCDDPGELAHGGKLL